MKKRIIILTFFALTVAISFGQNQVDALRYSFITPGGTARFMGVAGAFNAVGADLSTMSTNPAGIGLFKSSEFTFTASIFASETKATYWDKTRTDNNTNFNVPNIGFVYNIPLKTDPQHKGWMNVQVGFALIRNNNFHNRILIEGTNPDNSLLDAYVEMANGTEPEYLNPFDTELAYQTYLIDPIEGTLNYTNKAPLYPDGSIAPVDQQKNILSEGYMNEMDFTVSANYGDQLYIGVSVGLPYIRYYEESRYREFNNVSDDTTTFDRFVKYNWLDTRGNGFNFKFGAIYKPVDLIRIGAAVHTPTYFNNMRDDYNASMESVLNNGEIYSHIAPLGTYDYKLETPLRAIGSMAFIIGQSGLISIDYEYVDYSSAQLKGYGYDFNQENQQISSIYRSVSNFRLGTEWRFGHFAIRGGYGYYGSPYQSDLNEGKRQIIAAGIGYRSQFFFIDFGYNHIGYTEDYYLYSSETIQAPPVNMEFRQNNYLLTIGMKY